MQPEISADDLRTVTLGSFRQRRGSGWPQFVDECKLQVPESVSDPGMPDEAQARSAAPFNRTIDLLGSRQRSNAQTTHKNEIAALKCSSLRLKANREISEKCAASIYLYICRHQSYASCYGLITQQPEGS